MPRDHSVPIGIKHVGVVLARAYQAMDLARRVRRLKIAGASGYAFLPPSKSTAPDFIPLKLLDERMQLAVLGSSQAQQGFLPIAKAAEMLDELDRVATPCSMSACANSQRPWYRASNSRLAIRKVA